MTGPGSEKILSMAKRRGFFYPSFEIYGGVAGMFDYGPLGTPMKSNIVAHWKKLYVLGEGFMEIDSPNVSPEMIFKASGHVDEFTDFSVVCNQCGEASRADHLLEGHVDTPDALSREDLAVALKEHGIKCPNCGGEVSAPEAVNLMFKTEIGPMSGRRGYLRPETAQAMFFTFALLYRINRDRMPMGIVQIGKGFRNEISPRQGMLRLREFNMMEAEVFVNPEDKTWIYYDEIKDEKIKLVPNDTEKEIETTVGKAVEDGVIDNEALAYFVHLTQKFLIGVGLDPAKLRFRQHLQSEMAHYAADCWDAEALTSYGWTELVGVADRGGYDLGRHMKFSNEELRAFEKYDEAIETEVEKAVPNMKMLGQLFRGDAVKVKEALEALSPEELKADPLVVEVGGAKHEVPKDAFEVSLVKEKVSGKRYTPHVIEPSYGLDRIFYTVMDHSYTEKDDYAVLKLKPAIAPIKFGIFPLMTKDGMDTQALEIDRKLRSKGLITYYDGSGSIGRRYARMDEVGTPFCVTVDYDSKDGTVTVRERDSTEQKRVAIDKLLDVASGLISGETDFSSL